MSNTETVAVILGISFVSIILICLVWTIMSYIVDASPPNNKLEDNIKEYDRQKR
tara:strand:- start:342 stop:503 length:162 start_codon:yes stop_codon:yes gene_type:complete